MTGGNRLESVELENTKTGERRIVKTPARLFHDRRQTVHEMAANGNRARRKRIYQNRRRGRGRRAWKNASRPPGALETSRPGVFAAGDVRSGSVKRCAAAVGEGGMAIAGVHEALGTQV